MTLERKIAAKARELVEGRKGGSQETAYRAACESLPLLLRSAGLAQGVGVLEE